jgi:hypothetical protein
VESGVSLMMGLAEPDRLVAGWSTSTSTSTSPTTTTTAGATTTTTTGGAVTVTANADSFVQSDVPTAGHGSDTLLYVDSSPTKITYLKFDTSALAGQPLSGATLKVTTTSGSTSGSPDTQVVRPVSDSSWTEPGLTYNTRPAVMRRTWEASRTPRPTPRTRLP